MKNQNLVSIITPVFNASAYLEKTIQSVIQQTHTHWELLLVLDRQSSDSSQEIIDKWAATDIRIKKIPSPLLSGVAANRNQALSHAQGAFVAFLDADDLWFSEKLAQQLDFMVSKKSDFSFCGYDWIDENNEKLHLNLPAPNKLAYRDLLFHTYPIGCLTVVLRKEAFKNISFPSSGSEDFILWLQLLKEVPYAHGLPTILASYRVLRNSRSRKKGRAAGFRWQTLRQIEKLSFLKSIFFFTAYAINSVKRLLWQIIARFVGKFAAKFVDS